MIKFPEWTRGDSDEAIASRRLRYLLLRASLELTERGGVTSLADYVGIERPVLHWSMKNGAFAVPTAAKIQEACGRALLRKEWLIFPLDIPTE